MEQKVLELELLAGAESTRTRTAGREYKVQGAEITSTGSTGREQKELVELILDLLAGSRKNLKNLYWICWQGAERICRTCTGSAGREQKELVELYWICWQEQKELVELVYWNC